jgi:hypothetical protein
MIMSQIFLVKTHNIDLTNILGAVIIKNSPGRWLDICDYQLADKFLEISAAGIMVREQGRADTTEFRNIGWSTRISDLEDYLDQAQSRGQQLLFGTHDLGEFEKIKNHFRDQLTTMTINYSVQDYPLLLTNVAEYHVYRLRHNQLPCTEVDRELLARFSDRDLIQEYVRRFHHDELIPQSHSVTADWSIDIPELFQEQSLDLRLQELDLGFNESGREFYRQWRSNYPG